MNTLTPLTHFAPMATPERTSSLVICSHMAAGEF